ncbi:toxin-antitoxin system HicB family antitoxin [Mycobacterium camsae]|uniref:toxin-antitoxin system HicB family antitoxin n=1 Tax=Mycobacterium gordonae TaxID=1778 RepID=UPI001980DFCF|nr:toxin-antitoxin system HicB family antitoxin [Mycobacterium gordonae]
MNRYTFRVEWCPEYDAYLAKCLELPFLTERAPLAQQAVALAAEAIERHLETCREEGSEAPPPLTERDHSGTFVVRTSRALHTRLVIEANEQGVSMNHWVVQQLSGRQSKGSFGELFFD